MSILLLVLVILLCLEIKDWLALAIYNWVINKRIEAIERKYAKLNAEYWKEYEDHWKQFGK
jgi:hypothetical protein